MSVIGIPIEIKAREFHGKLWLSAELARAGHKVALGDKSHLRATLFEEVKPDIYISKSMCKGGGTEKIFEQLKEYGASVTVLDSEGGLGSSKNKWLETRVTEELLEYVDAIFAWGDIQANALYEEAAYPRECIHVTGNPRFDLLHPELRELYSERAKELREEFGSYVLINTNFGVANSYSEENIKQVFDEREININKRRLEYQSRIFEEFLSITGDLSNAVEKEIIVRPHPGENHETYRSEFDDASGIHVEFSGDVRHWIMGADAVIHNNCTTGIESALLNKEVIAFEPDVGMEAKEFSLPNFVSHSANTLDEVLQYIDGAGNKIEYKLTDEQKSELKRWLANVDEMAAPKMAKVIDRLTERGETAKYPSLSTPQKMKSIVKQQPITPHILRICGLDKRMNKKRTGKGKQKIPDLSIEEVKSNLDKMNINTNNIAISRVTHTDNVFWIDGSSASSDQN